MKDKKIGKTSIRIPIENDENLIMSIDTFSSLIKGLIKDNVSGIRRI